MISHYPPREQGKTFFEQNHAVIKLLDEEPREKATPFCFSRTPPPPPPPSQKPLKNHQILWKTCVENDVCRNPQRGSFVWLEKVGSIVGGFSKDNGNGSKNARFFKLCRNYVNWVKMSTDVLLIKPIAFYFWKFSLSSRSMSALIN